MRFLFGPTGVRTEQDLYVRLIDSVTKQVSPIICLALISPVSDPAHPYFSDTPLQLDFLGHTNTPFCIIFIIHSGFVFSLTVCLVLLTWGEMLEGARGEQNHGKKRQQFLGDLAVMHSQTFFFFLAKNSGLSGGGLLWDDFPWIYLATCSCFVLCVGTPKQVAVSEMESQGRCKI